METQEGLLAQFHCSICNGLWGLEGFGGQCHVEVMLKDGSESGRMSSSLPGVPGCVLVGYTSFFAL